MTNENRWFFVYLYVTNDDVKIKSEIIYETIILSIIKNINFERFLLIFIKNNLYIIIIAIIIIAFCIFKAINISIKDKK